MTPICRSDVWTLIHESEAEARRLGRRLRLPSHDREDLRQELLTDLIARLPAFDPLRGSIGSFAGIVLRHKASRIANLVRRERALFGEAPISLDELLPGQEGTRAQVVSEAEGYSAWLGQPTDKFQQVERRLAVASGVAALDEPDCRVCLALTSTTVEELAASGFAARSTLYRQLGRIRLDLLANGIGPTPPEGVVR